MTLEFSYGGLYKVISGGQTGADYAGLLAARHAGVRTGGTAPANFKTQLGPNPQLAEFGLVAEGDYHSRTVRNVRDSDGTVLLAHDFQSPGTVLTRRTCFNEDKVLLELDLKLAIQQRAAGNVDAMNDELLELAQKLVQFLKRQRIQVLNVAGNREIAGSDFVHQTTFAVVSVALSLLDAEGLLLKAADLEE